MEETEAALATLAGSLGEQGEIRGVQIEMARAVAAAVREERPLVVQAGTGTGRPGPTWSAHCSTAGLGGW